MSDPARRIRRFRRRAREAVRRAVGEQIVPGAVLLASVRGRVWMHEALGAAAIVPVRRPLRRDTLFDMASVTKPMATMFGILALARDGRLPEDFDAPLGRLLPFFRGSNKQDLPLHRLLSHSSGLPPYLDLARLESDFPGRPPHEQVYESIRRLPLAYEPGTTVRYSCLNFVVAARIVQEISGVRLDRFLGTRFWRPMGLRRTGFFLSAALRRHCAPTTCESGAGPCLQGVVHDPLARRLQSGGAFASGNAGLFATAAELHRLGRLLLQSLAPEAPVPDPVPPECRFPAALVRRIWQPHSPPGAAPVFGLGWRVHGPNTDFGRPERTPDRPMPVSHTGYTGTLVWIDPADAAVLVLLTHRVHPEDTGTVHPLRCAVLDAFREALRPE